MVKFSGNVTFFLISFLLESQINFCSRIHFCDPSMSQQFVKKSNDLSAANKVTAISIEQCFTTARLASSWAHISQCHDLS